MVNHWVYFLWCYVCSSVVNYRFGGTVNDYPHPEAEPKAFMKCLKNANAQVGPVYSPIKKCKRPWIEEAVLSSEYYGSCSIM
jgi:hypothetical protein